MSILRGVILRGVQNTCILGENAWILHPPFSETSEKGGVSGEYPPKYWTSPEGGCPERHNLDRRGGGCGGKLGYTWDQCIRVGFAGVVGVLLPIP